MNTGNSSELYKLLKQIEHNLWTLEKAAKGGTDITKTYLWTDTMARLSALAELVKHIQSGEPSWVLHALRKEGM